MVTQTILKCVICEQFLLKWGISREIVKMKYANIKGKSNCIKKSRDSCSNAIHGASYDEVPTNNQKG